jgi:hypothetical protein
MLLTGRAKERGIRVTPLSPGVVVRDSTLTGCMAQIRLVFYRRIGKNRSVIFIRL